MGASERESSPPKLHGSWGKWWYTIGFGSGTNPLNHQLRTRMTFFHQFILLINEIWTTPPFTDHIPWVFALVFHIVLKKYLAVRWRRPIKDSRIGPRSTTQTLWIPSGLTWQWEVPMFRCKRLYAVHETVWLVQEPLHFRVATSLQSSILWVIFQTAKLNCQIITNKFLGLPSSEKTWAHYPCVFFVISHWIMDD